MKIFNTILTAVCGVAILASCDKLNETPSFSKSESFVSFPSSSASITEDGGQIVIPVNMASINPMVSSVSYVLGAEGDTAIQGVDYEDTNESAVLEFDGESRSAEIVINILPHLGDFTGDKTFSIEILSATGLKIGAEASFKVTISDIDHPLANILGSYTVTCTDHFKGAQSYTLNLTKDAAGDVTKVWCDAICPLLYGKAGNWKPNVYGTAVKDEETGLFTISFPAGQELGDVGYGTEYLVIATFATATSVNIDDTGTIILQQQEDGTFTTDQGICVYDGTFWQGGLLTGTTVWTKN